MTRSKRRLVASFVLVILLILWIWAAASLGSRLTAASGWLNLVFYIVTGLGWVFLMRPVFRWMNSGPE